LSDIGLSKLDSGTGESPGRHAPETTVEPDRLNYFNYFTEIEDTFVRRRGKHLLLSPLDWALIESWKERGVPLHVALRGIETAFDSHAAKPRRRSVKSLMYCQEEVEAQYSEWLEGQRGASSTVAHASDESSNELASRRSKLPFPREVIMAHLVASRDLLKHTRAARLVSSQGDELDDALSRAIARLEELEKDFSNAARPDGEKLEGSLTDLEQLLDRSMRSAIAPETIESMRARAAEELKPYRARMESATYDQTLDNLLAKALREACGVPRLSLFYL
jgi:hypothetical protein